MLTRTALVPATGYRPPSRWRGGHSASIRQVDWDSDGPITTVVPLHETRARVPEAEAPPTDALPGLRRGVILDILV